MKKQINDGVLLVKGHEGAKLYCEYENRDAESFIRDVERQTGKNVHEIYFPVTDFADARPDTSSQMVNETARNLALGKAGKEEKITVLDAENGIYDCATIKARVDGSEAVADAEKYFDDLNGEDYTKSAEHEEMAASEYRCREMGGEWVPAHSRKGTYGTYVRVRGFCRKKKR
jgi:hypothetical protein